MLIGREKSRIFELILSLSLSNNIKKFEAWTKNECRFKLLILSLLVRGLLQKLKSGSGSASKGLKVNVLLCRFYGRAGISELAGGARGGGQPQLGGHHCLQVQTTR